MTSPTTRKLLVIASILMALSALPASLAAAPQRPSPSNSPAGIVALQQEIVSRLSGASELRPGIRLANRSSIENRQEARAFLSELFKRFGLDPKRQAYGVEGENIFAVLSCGKPAAAAVVFGAHYDTARTSPGANDNASGVAAVAAVAQQMKRVRKRSRDVIFVFFDEEERGLRGSRAFAQLLKDEGRIVHSVHTIDQMGWDQDGDRAIELEVPYDGAQELYASAAKALKMNITIHITKETGSDHSAFRKLGFKAVGITEEYRNKDTTPFIHRPGDTYETISFDYLASTTRLITRALEMLVR